MTLNASKAKALQGDKAPAVMDEGFFAWTLRGFDCRNLLVYRLYPLVFIILAIECATFMCVRTDILVFFRLL